MAEIAHTINRQISENLELYKGIERLKALQLMNDQVLAAYHTCMN